MNIANKPLNGYSSGTEMWRDTILSYGIDESIIICRNYLDINLKREHSEGERQFCRELFIAMFEATAVKITHAGIVYPYPFEEANRRMEISYYHKSRALNEACACAIDQAIRDGQYDRNYCNTENAAWQVLLEYGFNRVCAILAHQIQRHRSDGRYSHLNKEWANAFTLSDKAFTFMNTHATLVDAMTTHIRKLYIDMDAERFALPGHEVNADDADDVKGYKITRIIMTEDEEGYVIAHNPDAVSPWVCWKIAVSDGGERRYDWGIYGDEQAAVDGFNARIFVALNNEERIL